MVIGKIETTINKAARFLIRFICFTLLTFSQTVEDLNIVFIGHRLIVSVPSVIAIHQIIDRKTQDTDDRYYKDAQ